jgi:hypothetical protein
MSLRTPGVHVPQFKYHCYRITHNFHRNARGSTPDRFQCFFKRGPGLCTSFMQPTQTKTMFLTKKMTTVIWKLRKIGDKTHLRISVFWVVEVYWCFGDCSCDLGGRWWDIKIVSYKNSVELCTGSIGPRIRLLWTVVLDPIGWRRTANAWQRTRRPSCSEVRTRM